MSASLHTETGLPNLTIQILNTRVHFIDIRYTPFTSVHYNLEHGLAIVTGDFSPLNLNYTNSFVKVQIRSDAPSHAISCNIFVMIGKKGSITRLFMNLGY